MPIQTKESPLEQLKKMQQATRELQARRKVNFLLKGEKGIGKSIVAIETSPKPVHVDSFDPDGTVHIDREMISNGSVIIGNYEHDDPDYPHTIKDWTSDTRDRISSKYFDAIGTYVFDGITFFLDKSCQATKKKSTAKGSPLAEDLILTQRGWAVAIEAFRIAMYLILDLPCHVIMTGHAKKFLEKVEQNILVGLEVPPSMQIYAPASISEYYFMRLETTGKKNPKGQPLRVLQTGNTDDVLASTRIGRNNFELYEKPDIRYLLEKAGYPADDKKF